VEALNENEGAVTLRFSVRDTGIGIAPDRLESLFESFTQADTSTTRKFGGTGLGLSISRQLAELMGGSIDAESVPGKGSIFHIDLTLGRQLERDLCSRPLESIIGARILAVDDNRTNRRLFTLLLQSWKCRYQVVPDAEDALKALREGIKNGDPFQLAIIDMQMPIMDGEELGVLIKSDPDLRDIELVMMSSMGRREDSKRLLEKGFSAYLTKPVKQSFLHDCLSTLLAETRGREETGAQEVTTRHRVADMQRECIRVLIAEDNAVNQRVALKILEKAGFMAEAVSNGLEAVAVLEKREFDIVLMDCQMPQMDGYEATQIIRNSDSMAGNRNIPIIAITANALQGDREKCLEAGMSDYIPKPINRLEVVSKIEQWVGDR